MNPNNNDKSDQEKLHPNYSAIRAQHSEDEYKAFGQFLKKENAILERRDLPILGEVEDPDAMSPLARNQYVSLLLEFHLTSDSLRKTIAPNLPPPLVVFIANDRFNAFACEPNNFPCIGINSAVVEITQWLFMRMMSDQNVLTQIGDSSIEVLNLPKFSLADKTRIGIQSANFPVMPKDSTRYYYATNLVNSAIHWVFGHEYAHLKNGHVLFLDKQSGISFADEQGISLLDVSSNSSIKPDYAQTMQAIEMDADCSAMVRMYDHACTGNNVSGMNSSDVPPMFRIFNSQDEWFYMQLFSVLSICRLFDQLQLNLDDVASRIHPPWRIRAYYMLLAFANAIAVNQVEQNPDEVRGKYEGMGLQVLAEVEKSFDAITGSTVFDNRLPEIAEFLASKDTNNYLDELRVWWSNIRLNLTKYARSPLADPVST